MLYYLWYSLCLLLSVHIYDAAFFSYLTTMPCVVVVIIVTLASVSGSAIWRWRGLGCV